MCAATRSSNIYFRRFHPRALPRAPTACDQAANKHAFLHSKYLSHGGRGHKKCVSKMSHSWIDIYELREMKKWAVESLENCLKVFLRFMFFFKTQLGLTSICTYIFRLTLWNHTRVRSKNQPNWKVATEVKEKLSYSSQLLKQFTFLDYLDLAHNIFSSKI